MKLSGQPAKREATLHSVENRRYLLVHQSVTVEITVRFRHDVLLEEDYWCNEKKAKDGAFLPLSVAFRAFYALY